MHLGQASLKHAVRAELSSGALPRDYIGSSGQCRRVQRAGHLLQKRAALLRQIPALWSALALRWTSDGHSQCLCTVLSTGLLALPHNTPGSAPSAKAHSAHCHKQALVLHHSIAATPPSAAGVEASPCMPISVRQSLLRLVRLSRVQGEERAAREAPAPDLEDPGVQLRGARNGDDSDNGSIGRGGTSRQRGQRRAARRAADDAAQRPLPKTSMGRRAIRGFNRMKSKLGAYLVRYSKEAWAAEAAIRAEHNGTAEDDEDADSEAEGDDTDDGGRGRAAGGRGAPRRQKFKTLHEPQAFLLIMLPDGKVRYTTSPGLTANEVVRHQRDYLVGAVQTMVQLAEMEATNDARAARGVKQGLHRGSLIGASKLAPSKQLRAAAREAFTKHVKPELAGIKMCAAADWKACRVVGGASTCCAGGQCKDARSILGYWPDDLACVSPLKASMNTDWNRRLLKVLQEQGFQVSMPEQAAVQRAPVTVRRPALRGTAPSAPPLPAEEVVAAAAQLLSVDLDQPITRAGDGGARRRQPAPAQLPRTSAAAPAAAGPRSTTSAGITAGHGAGPAVADSNSQRPGRRALPPTTRPDTVITTAMQEGLLFLLGDDGGSVELRTQICEWLGDARSQLRAPACRVEESDFEFQTHGRLNAAHAPLLNLLKDKPELFEDDARSIIASLQAQCCEGVAATGHAAADGGAPTDEEALQAAEDHAVGDGDAGGDSAPRVSQRQRAPSRKQAAASEAVASPSRTSKRQQRQRELGTSTLPDVRLAAADAGMEVQRPQAVAGGSARSRRPAQQRGGSRIWVPDLHLGTKERQYPISESIAAMLPQDAAMRTCVLADPVAAKAIMRITDTAVCRASLSGHSAASKHMHARIIMDGAETLLTKVSEDALREWLSRRDIRPPVQRKGNSEQANRCQVKVLDVLLEYMEDREAVKHATERLQRSIDEHAGV